MENNTEGSEQLTDEQIHENLRAHAEALDAGQDSGQPAVSKTPASTNKPGEAGSEAEEDRASEAETGKPTSSETPTEKGKEAEGEEPEAKPGEQKPVESKWKKAKKDQARFDRNWQKLEQRSRAVAERERRLSEIESRRTQQPTDMSQRPRFKSGDYWEAAEGFEAEGLRLMRDDPEAAQEKFQFAANARMQAQKAYEVEYQESQREAYTGFEKTWTETAEAVIKDEPALADPESELSQKMVDLLEQYPMLGQHPEGFKYAHEILKLRITAGEVSELRAQRTKDKKEIERLNGLTSLSGGPDASKHTASGSDFNSMSEDEQREYLRRDAERADAA